MIIRRATRDDIARLNGRLPYEVPTHKSWGAFEDDVTICIGGFYRVDNRWLAYFDVGDWELLEKYKYPITKRVFKEVKNYDGAVWAIANTKYPNAVKWITLMGFNPSIVTGVYRRK